jgi:hypothetical protein
MRAEPGNHALGLSAGLLTSPDPPRRADRRSPRRARALVHARGSRRPVQTKCNAELGNEPERTLFGEETPCVPSLENINEQLQ